MHILRKYCAVAGWSPLDREQDGGQRVLAVVLVVGRACVPRRESSPSDEIAKNLDDLQMASSTSAFFTPHLRPITIAKLPISPAWLRAP